MRSPKAQIQSDAEAESGWTDRTLALTSTPATRYPDIFGLSKDGLRLLAITYFKFPRGSGSEYTLLIQANCYGA